jgi:hypothetical protein
MTLPSQGDANPIVADEHATVIGMAGAIFGIAPAYLK